MKIDPRAAQDKRIRECFDFLWYVCNKELNHSELLFVKDLRRGYFERGSLTEEQERNLFALTEQYKKP